MASRRGRLKDLRGSTDKEVDLTAAT